MDSRKVRDILIDSGINDIRLVINRFSNHYFRKSDLYEDLDTVIDESGIQLIAIVPEDNDILEKFSKGLPLSDKSSAKKAFERLSARFLGERVPCINCTRCKKRINDTILYCLLWNFK